MINFLWFIIGFIAGFLFLVLVAVCDFFIKKRKAKKVIKSTVDGCSDINELIGQLEQFKKIFIYENLEDEKND